MAFISCMHHVLQESESAMPSLLYLPLFLSKGIVLTCFKSSVIIPLPKKSKMKCQNDWCPVVTPKVSECFEVLTVRY